MSTKTKLAWLIAFATLIRCIAAISVYLGNDEVYYLTYAQHLQWNYFDHPPMVALLIRLSTFNLHFTNEFFVRLGPIILSAINTFLIFDIVRKLKNEQAGFLAALFFTASPYCSIISGLFIMPDALQVFFWIISLHSLISIVSQKPTKKQLNKQLILFGITVGLCTMCKVHGMFLWFGLFGYCLIYAPKLLLNRYLYLAALITLIIISPILIWNIQNKFITYNFHTNRVSINGGVHLLSFIREVVGGVLYNNPINYLLIIVALVINKKKSYLDNKVKRLLLFTSLPLIITLLFTSLFRDTLPHWSGPAFIPLIIIAACQLSSTKQFRLGNSIYIKLAYIANIIVVVSIMLGVLMVNYFPGTIGKQEYNLRGRGDFTLDMYGWKQLKSQFKNIREKNITNNISKTPFIISDKWFPAAHIDNYIAQPLKLDFIALGSISDIHTYAWLNQYRKKLLTGNDAYFITFSNNFSDPNLIYNGLFTEISKPVILPQYRNGKLARNVFLYLLKGYIDKKAF